MLSPYCCRFSDFRGCGRMAEFSHCGWHSCRCGRDPDLFAEYFILFLALAFLEDSGYMARVACVMDGIMGKAGLSGGISAHGAGLWLYRLPAIMATGAGDGEKPAENHAGDTVYVLLGQTADLCLIFDIF